MLEFTLCEHVAGFDSFVVGHRTDDGNETTELAENSEEAQMWIVASHLMIQRPLNILCEADETQFLTLTLDVSGES